jgi:hypothetical protein
LLTHALHLLRQPTQGISFSDSESTGIYSATMQADGELMHAVAGMHIFKTITPEQVQSRQVPTLTLTPN